MDDLVKFIIAIIVIAAVAVGLAYLSDNFTNWDVTTWFDFNKGITEGVIMPSVGFSFYR